MRLGLARILLTLALAVVPIPLRAEIAVPELRTRVTDLTGTLERSAQTSLEERLRAFEQKHGSQIAVLIVPTTQPETIEQYSIRVAENWKLGRKGIDDGAILLVAMKDRTMRIEAGYGLEGVLNDATCKRIVSEIITPEFERGDFRGGIERGIDRMIQVIEGEELPAPAAWPRNGGHGNSSSLVFLAFLIMGVASALRRFVGRLGAALLVGISAAVISSFLVSTSAALLIGVLTFVLALFGTAGGFWASGRRGYAGGFGGGGFGGGGFRGGGGGFGGGGASGRW